MFRKTVLAVVIAVVICSAFFAVCAMCALVDEKSAKESEVTPVKVNNAVCPVTGDKVNMKDPVTVEYNGKIYNLCCPMCVSEFNKDPGKYSAKAEAQSTPREQK